MGGIQELGLPSRFRKRAGYPLSGERGREARTFLGEAGDLVNNLVVDVRDPCAAASALLTQAQLLLVARQNVAREVPNAVRAQAEAAQVAGNHLLGHARVGDLADDAQLTTGARIAGEDVSDGGLIRLMLDVERQTTCLRRQQLASTQITRMVAHGLRWRMRDLRRRQAEGVGAGAIPGRCDCDVPRGRSTAPTSGIPASLFGGEKIHYD